jgi:hypothetical protein
MTSFRSSVSCLFLQAHGAGRTSRMATLSQGIELRNTTYPILKTELPALQASRSCYWILFPGPKGPG